MSSTLGMKRMMTLPSDQEASGRTLGDEEIALLTQAIHSGTLTATKGTFTASLERRFGEMLGAKHAFACSSGSAAIHAAVAAIDPEPGDEVVSTSITDMGALTPLLYQGAIPVFADVEPSTCNVSARTIRPCLSERTKAIVVTHLFGNPCEMGPIVELARQHGVPIIEDCAQAFLARSDGRNVGTIGAIGCFSLQQGKHITTGEGGLLVTDDDALARRIRLFINKAWPYGEPNPDHEFIALNYRMCELQGAVALAQLEKLEDVVDARIAAAERLTARLAGCPGLETPAVEPGSVHTYWRYCLRVDEHEVPGGPQAMADPLKARGVLAAPRYIQKPAFDCRVFREKNTFGRSRFPFTLARPEAVDYAPARFPGTYKALRDVLVLSWNERFTEEHVDYIADAVLDAADQLRGGPDNA